MRGYSGCTMSSESELPNEVTLKNCAWCDGTLGANVMPAKSAKVFCSRRCEIEANFWLYQEMCVIEITHPSDPKQDHCDSP